MIDIMIRDGTRLEIALAATLRTGAPRMAGGSRMPRRLDSRRNRHVSKLPDTDDGGVALACGWFLPSRRHPSDMDANLLRV